MEGMDWSCCCAKDAFDEGDEDRSRILAVLFLLLGTESVEYSKTTGLGVVLVVVVMSNDELQIFNDDDAFNSTDDKEDKGEYEIEEALLLPVASFSLLLLSAAALARAAIDEGNGNRRIFCRSSLCRQEEYLHSDDRVFLRLVWTVLLLPGFTTTTTIADVKADLAATAAAKTTPIGLGPDTEE